jgi:hypothetical protein
MVVLAKNRWRSARTDLSVELKAIRLRPGGNIMPSVDQEPQQGSQPTHFVVELITQDGPRYALCQTLTVVAPGSESLPAGVMAEFMGNNTLRAVAVPDEGAAGDDPVGAHWASLTTSSESGRDA